MPGIAGQAEHERAEAERRTTEFVKERDDSIRAKIAEARARFMGKNGKRAAKFTAVPMSVKQADKAIQQVKAEHGRLQQRIADYPQWRDRVALALLEETDRRKVDELLGNVARMRGELEAIPHQIAYLSAKLMALEVCKKLARRRELEEECVKLSEEIQARRKAVADAPEGLRRTAEQKALEVFEGELDRAERERVAIFGDEGPPAAFDPDKMETWPREATNRLAESSRLGRMQVREMLEK